MPKDNQNNSKDDSPKKWNWYKSLWKYKYEIAAAVVVTGAVLGFVVATHGVGALAVGAVAAHYSPTTIAGLTLGSVGFGAIAVFTLNKACKSSNSKSQSKLNDFFKGLLGTDDKTKNLEKILKKEGLDVDSKVLSLLVNTDIKSDNPKLDYTVSKGGYRVEVKDSKYNNIIVRDYRKLQEQSKERV
ncbi:MAG: hypothetical protein V4694_00055 [Pseudomonadota bacterium]